MSLKTIIDRVAADTGFLSPDSNPEQRQLLIDKINDAAAELYEEEDLPLALEECYIKPTNDYRISLPPFVGEIRAIRSRLYNNLWNLADIRARYNSVDWPEKWNKGRLISILPVGVEITNTSPGTVTVANPDSTLTVTLVGETDDSRNDSETVTCSAASVSWTKNFTKFTSIQKNKPTTQDVTITDADGQVFAVIYANQMESRYIILDVSIYPGIQDCADGTFVMEVLYKPILPILYFDNDVFPIPNFDRVVILKTKQLLAEDKPGQEQRAVLMDTKAQRSVDKLTENRTGTVDKFLRYRRNPLHGLFRRGRYYGGCDYGVGSGYGPYY